MASGLLIKQKQLLAGDGIAIAHGETASTISLAENALDNSVRIYDATVEAETGVITITDGTPVADLRIGDEIRTPDGVYQKIKDNITTTGSADGTRIKVSGITKPADANGVYVLTETEKVWKHESADYWISQFISLEGDSYWLIANTSSPSNPGLAIFTGPGSSSSMPWEISDWSDMNGSGSSPVLENAPTEQTITDTLALFEYASLPVEPENIVQSVNGKKPDASGNVTIETSSGGLTSVSVGNGLTGNGTSSSPITLDLSNYEAPGSVQINSSAALNSAIKLSSGFTEHSGGSGGASEMAQSWHNELTMDADGLLLMTDVGATIKVPSISKLKLEQGIHSGVANEAYGLAVVGSNGKLPSSILPAVVSHAYGLPIVEVGGNICHLLDATYTELNLADFARNVSAIEFYIRSASDTITGNIVIIPCVGSTELNPITLSVTTTDVKKTIEFNPPVTGMISFKRDISSESDTLKDVDVVSAIIGSDLMIMVNS